MRKKYTFSAKRYLLKVSPVIYQYAQYVALHAIYKNHVLNQMGARPGVSDWPEKYQIGIKRGNTRTLTINIGRTFRHLEPVCTDIKKSKIPCLSCQSGFV